MPSHYLGLKSEGIPARVHGDIYLSSVILAFAKKERARNSTISDRLLKMHPTLQEYLSLRARQGVLDTVKIGKVWYSSRRAIEQYLSEHSKR